MSKEPSLDLIYQTLLQVKSDTGALKQAHETQSAELASVKKSHYELKEDYTKHKAKILLGASAIALFISTSLTALWNYLTKHN